MRLAPFHNIEYKVDSTGNYHQLAKILDSFRPDTLMFTHDDPALHFRRHFLEKCKCHPRVLGFDNIAATEDGIETLTTYGIDCVEMGRASVRKLFEPASLRSKPSFERVEGDIIVRD